MNTVFANNLKKLMAQLKISNAQLAKALNVDPSLISRWLKNGCGERRAPEHALAIEQFILKRRLTPENESWLAAETGSAALAEGSIANWLYPEGIYYHAENKDGDFANMQLVNSFRSLIENRPSQHSEKANLAVCSDAVKIAEMLRSELSEIEEGSAVKIYLSSESSGIAIDPQILSVLRECAESRKLSFTMLVESANNSSMISRLASAYMPMLVQGQLTISLIQGTPQTFTVTMNVIIPECAAIIITEAIQRNSTAVGTLIRDKAMVKELLSSFNNSTRFARPMMIAYDDTFARNIIEIFFEEYGIHGSLDVIKSGMNPLYFTVEDYGRVLQSFKHPDDQFAWRYEEFARFKSSMDEVLKTSRFREILSLTKLKEIAETGRCRMPSMYFFDAGICYLDAQDCVNLLDGYIHFLETVPNFQVVLLEDEQLFMPNSCWHIKNNKHVMIHSWNIDEPKMVYSDQLMLIDEFQRHFDSLWSQTDTAGSKRRVIETLTALRNRCAEHIKGE